MLCVMLLLFFGLMVRPKASQADELRPSVDSTVIGKKHISHMMFLYSGFGFQSSQVEEFSISTIMHIDAIAVVPKGVSQHG